MMSSPEKSNSDSTPSPLPAPVVEGERGDEVGELIARLEKATGPDRELDARIHAAITWCHRKNAALTFRPNSHTYKVVIGDARATDQATACYTASIDDALTLVRKGWAWALRKHCDCAGDAAHAQSSVSRVAWDKKDDDAEFFKSAEARHPTPAIALCIAALKARAALAKARAA